MDPNTPGGAQPQTSPTPPSNEIGQANSPGSEKKVASPQPPTEAPKKTPDQILQEANLAGMTETQLADLESGDAARIAKALGVEPPPPDKGGENAPPAPAAEDHGPERISLKALPNKETRVKMAEAISAFRTGEFATVEEALIAKFGLKTASAAPEPAADGTAPAKKDGDPQPPEPKDKEEPFVTPELKALEDKLTDLQKQKDTAKAEYDYDKADAINEQMLDLKLEIRDAKRQAESQKAVIQQFQAAEEASRQRVMSVFGEYMTDPDSEFNEQLDVEITLAERKNDPILNQPDWPEKIANKVAKRLNITGGGIQADPKQDETQHAEEHDIPPPPRRDIRVPGAPVPGGANSSALTPSTALAELDKLTPAEREKVLALL